MMVGFFKKNDEKTRCFGLQTLMFVGGKLITMVESETQHHPTNPFKMPFSPQKNNNKVMCSFFSPQVRHLGMIANLIRLEISPAKTSHTPAFGHRAIELGSTVASSVATLYHSRLKLLLPPTIYKINPKSFRTKLLQSCHCTPPQFSKNCFQPHPLCSFFLANK